jgi:hypothetical protein
VPPSAAVALSRVRAISRWCAKTLIFPVDYPNETKKKTESPNSVIRVTEITKYSVIRLFGSPK